MWVTSSWGRMCAAALLLLVLAPIATASDLSFQRGFAGEENVLEGSVTPLLTNDRAALFVEERHPIQLGEYGLQGKGGQAIGFRSSLTDALNVGAWIARDELNSRYGTSFSRMGYGVELLGDFFEYRLNTYQPTSDPIASPNLLQFEMVGGRLGLSGAQEVPMAGSEMDAGFRLPLRFFGINPEKHSLRMYGGAYRFHHELAETVSGPLGRLEWLSKDPLNVLPGMTFSVSARQDYNGFEGGFRLRVPFSYRAPRSKDRPGVNFNEDILELLLPIVRSTRIFSLPSAPEPLQDVETGTTFTTVRTVTADQDLQAEIDAAGSNALIIADGSRGPFLTGLRLRPNQTVVGGGSYLFVQGLRTGLIWPYRPDGYRATIDASSAHLPPTQPGSIVLSRNSHLAGLTAIGASSIPGIYGGNTLGRIVLRDLDIQPGNVGIKLGSGYDWLSIRDSRISSGAFSSAVEIGNWHRGVWMDNIFVDAFAGVSVGSKNGNIFVRRLTVFGPEVGGHGLIIGSDNESVAIIDSNIEGSTGGAVTIGDRNANVLLGGIRAFAGGGAFGGTGLQLGSGNGAVEVIQSEISGNFAVSAGSKNGAILIEASALNPFWGTGISVGDNNNVAVDTTVIRNTQTDPDVHRPAVSMGSGNRFTLLRTQIVGAGYYDVVKINRPGNLLAGAGNRFAGGFRNTFCRVAGLQQGGFLFEGGQACPQ